MRIGFLVDSNGGAQPIFLPEKITKDWNYVRELQASMDKNMDDTKANIKSFLDTKTQLTEVKSETEAGGSELNHKCQDSAHRGEVWDLLRDAAQGLPQMRKQGLRKFLRLEESGTLDGNMMRTWAWDQTWYENGINGVRSRYIGHRNDFYRNLALNLCRQYRVIAIEKLSLKTMAEEKDKEKRIELAAKYRQLASLSTFILYLKQAAMKTGTEILELDPAYTTLKCAKCGDLAVNNGEVLLRCPRGHLFDQDRNAAMNLLACFWWPFGVSR